MLTEFLFKKGLVSQKRYNLRYISCEDDLKDFLSSNFKELGVDYYYRIVVKSGGFFEYSNFEVLTKFENRWVLCFGKWGDVLSVCYDVKMNGLELIADDGSQNVAAFISHRTAICDFPDYGINNQYEVYLSKKTK